MSAIIEAVRGMRDLLPAEQRGMAQVRAQIETLFFHHGYSPIELPILEQRDLYQRKLGEDLAGKLYEFNFGGRDLVMRPEWTASVLRTYVAHLQDQPLPLRFCYSGPVFRYERPQRHTYRQFTQAGVELVGGPGPRADAEVVALACAGLDRLGVQPYRVVLGHIGLVRELLSHLAITERARNILIWGLERIRTKGIAPVYARLAQHEENLPIDPALLEGLDDARAEALLLRLLQTMQINLGFGSRPPEAIIERLLRKVRRDDPLPRVERALSLLEQLGQIRGTPSEALPQAAALLGEVGMNPAALEDMRAILALLAAHGVNEQRIVLDFGLGRGLNYYTGLIFEIYDAHDMQICGGGRYDDLVTALGGRVAVPAVGFAYGLERVIAAMAHPLPPEPSREVLVVAVTDADYPYALRVAQQLREAGYVASLDLRGRSLTSNLRDATRRAIGYAAIVGAEERAQGEAVLRNLVTREEQRIRVN